MLVVRLEFIEISFRLRRAADTAVCGRQRLNVRVPSRCGRA